MNNIYIFEIQDDNNKHKDNELMLYKIKDSLLTPLIDDFKKGWPTFPPFEIIMEYLIRKNINTIITYFPNDLDTICSHPYEIGDFTKYEIENGADYHRFYHFEFSPSKEQAEILKKNKITIKCLENKEINELERTLSYHNTF